MAQLRPEEALIWTRVRRTQNEAPKAGPSDNSVSRLQDCVLTHGLTVYGPVAIHAGHIVLLLAAGVLIETSKARNSGLFRSDARSASFAIC